ncbi:MAG: hypothetical protein WCE54_14570 [Ignavibacteriaceae bacterium]
MNKNLIIIFITLLFCVFFPNTYAQRPQGKDFGFGIIVGDPTGGTLKFFSNRNNAFVVDFGASYFGSPRIGVDYLWQFNAFNSDIANLYAGAGGTIGFGRGNGFYYKDKYIREKSNVGLGARGVFGVNVIPRRTPLEFFFEVGVLLGVAPDFSSSADVGLGMRFYP